MAEAALARLLPDGNRLHLQQGPIDLVIGAFGGPDAVSRAYAAAARRFEGLLAELCGELDMLRRPIVPDSLMPDGPVARRMVAAVAPLASGVFLTPMAAVAGSVAEEILAAMTAAAPLRRAFVNNGGDIALHLQPGESFAIGLVARPDDPRLFAKSRVAAAGPVRGIATSGRHGRSFSLGIADAVTVLAQTAAMADAAATVIANAVDLPGHPAIERKPANMIQTQSDLGDIAVTRHVGALAPAEIATALAAGASVARRLCREGWATAAALHLQGETVIVPDSHSLTTTMPFLEEETNPCPTSSSGNSSRSSRTSITRAAPLRLSR